MLTRKIIFKIEKAGAEAGRGHWTRLKHTQHPINQILSTRTSTPKEGIDIVTIKSDRPDIEDDEKSDMNGNKTKHNE